MESQDLTQASAKNGLIVGLVGIIATYVLYLIGTDALLGAPSFAIWAIMLGLIAYFATQAKQMNGGYFTFGEAFKHTFIIAMVSAVVGAVFTYILYNFLAPELSDEVKRITIERTEEMMESFGGGGEAMDAAMEQLENEDYSMTIGKILLQIVYAAVGYGIYSSIVAAIIKKKEPEEFLK